ncbi:hypothetical protein ACT414_18650 (plasmid) [Acinetobacter baumannii]
MESWDGYLETYPIGGGYWTRSSSGKGQSKDIKVGSRIIVTNPDAVSQRVGKIKAGDVGKVVCVDAVNGILAYNPNWNNPDRSIDDDYDYNGPACFLLPCEFEIIS